MNKFVATFALITVIAFIVFLLSIIPSCGHGPDGGGVVTTQGLTTMNIQTVTAVYADGTTVPVLGYKVLCATRADLSDAVVMDIGVNPVFQLSLCLVDDGIRYIAAVEYDSLGESKPSTVFELQRVGGVITEIGSIQ